MSEDQQRFEEADVESHAHGRDANDEPAEDEETEVEAHILSALNVGWICPATPSC